MFSSCQRLDQRTPNNGIDRESYIQLLADEYRDTTNLGKLLQPLTTARRNEINKLKLI